ncbi:hypothetical protein JQ557_24100 [Bradyrhizobium sp. U87765 SZCCT0131]|uniref:hypothetical protein n=1 Tax=unclassified Bradyrhizobium TaxID=2631580 RepID=UPI001BAC0429|nr:MULTISPECIES: hypothetical protein [unclassified Bradyrhizobium]MBR1221102.1 hypothetical protein [Bradyrhizobium sp. U87765 SZCCT0131]MBR1260078.1 hypothetical protein [Bradyrhizobium sp. U87765 SZCCT0134]MBR1307673.1 hypothetical protein [Bradyrhizobium sp. U87765 SZCCT0110]MBR1321627.1 hypothetical protein [Bradyrhizobium sp. U87765 SZCCT0109]MBR1349940.1 hypothetical protein [Bradyrhizobium sp. U87765 SZCCT0048]
MRLLLGTVICVALAASAGATEQGGSSAAPAKRKAPAAPASLSEAYSQTQAAGVPNAHIRTAPAPSSGSDRPWSGMHVGVGVGGTK